MTLLVTLSCVLKRYIDALWEGKHPLGLLLLLGALLFGQLLLKENGVLFKNHLGLVLRKGLTGLIYDKALRLSMGGVAEASPGKLINICSGDMTIIVTNMLTLPFIFSGPIVAIIVIYLLYQSIGITALYCLLLTFALFCLQLPLSAFVLRLRLRISSTSDARLGLLQTLIRGIQTVKAYAWELPLIKRARAARSV